MRGRLKSEIRNPKSERNPNAEIRKADGRSDVSWNFGLRPSGFFRISDFGFRISFSYISKHLHAMIESVGHKNLIVVIDGDGVGQIKLTRFSARTAPVQQE